MTTPETIGVLLAGGLARRMGGGDKPLRRLAGRTILERAAARLQPQCRYLIVNANGDPARFADTGLPVVQDTVPGFAGPLAGILAALEWAAAHRPEAGFVVSVAADTPFLPRDLVARLHAAREEAGTPLACAESGSRAHPVNALWPVDLRSDLRHALVEEDLRKINRFTARHGVAHASWPIEPYDPFFNANTPEDMMEAEAILRRYKAA
jgi:molybdopterin-guanine dinucleotide biosynthesis protein A